LLLNKPNNHQGFFTLSLSSFNLLKEEGSKNCDEEAKAKDQIASFALLNFPSRSISFLKDQMRKRKEKNRPYSRFRY